VALVLTEFLL